MWCIKIFIDFLYLIMKKLLARGQEQGFVLPFRVVLVVLGARDYAAVPLVSKPQQVLGRATVEVDELDEVVAGRRRLALLPVGVGVGVDAQTCGGLFGRDSELLALGQKVRVDHVHPLGITTLRCDNAYITTSGCEIPQQIVG